jgi:predicted transcriptional regulator
MPEFQIDPAERTRLLESRYSTLRERVLVVNQNLIAHYKKLYQEIRHLNTEMKELRSDMFEIKEAMKNVIEDLQSCAKIENLKIGEKYINLWNPLHFVTEEEVLKLIEEGGKNSRQIKRNKRKG